MFTNKMNLKEMIDFKPDAADMASLDLDVVLYIKMTIISIEKEINYNFIRYIFDSDKADEFKAYFKNIDNTIFYDYKYDNGDNTRVITMAELYSKQNYVQTESLLNDILSEYTHEAEVLFDIYTHEDHEYRLSNLDGIVKNDQLR